MGKFIENIEIKNFKSIRHQRIDGCKRINVFIGSPNVGKSNILEALGLFCPLLFKYPHVHLKFTDLCRIRHASDCFFNQDITQSVDVNINNNIKAQLSVNEKNRLEITYSQTSINSGQDDIIFDGYFDEAQIEEIKNRYSRIFSVETGEDFGNFYFGSQEKDEPNVSYIKKYDFSSNSPVEISGNAWLSIPYGYNLLDLLQGNPKLREEFVDVFAKYNLKFAIDARTKSIVLIKELKDGSIVIIPYYLMADTLRRMIFYKTAIATNNNSILLFEEPEAHMFPPYISSFTGDMIQDGNNNQYFMATHSPFIINDLLEDARKDLAIYLVGYKNGETQIKSLSEKELNEIYQYGVDLFFNIESYLD